MLLKVFFELGNYGQHRDGKLTTLVDNKEVEYRGELKLKAIFTVSYKIFAFDDPNKGETIHSKTNSLRFRSFFLSHTWFKHNNTAPLGVLQIITRFPTG
jgi:hypothetical protein